MIYGRLDPVFDALRACAPEVTSACCSPGADGGDPYLRVSYRNGDPRRVVWDDDLVTYRWDSGPDAPQPLSDDPLQAAETIVRSLGAPMTGRLR
ncbi:hypothetical protein ACQPZ8_37475 [Actinomadura nitritigenes]|uniref:hypothetical protein n=1 Tax=Actinomadura nitritigenes TaxID=134602 RepID=UPI003D920EC7